MGVRRHEQPPRRTKTGIPPIPDVYSKPETYPFLRMQKAAVLKTLNFQHRSVTRQRDLGILLFAVGRKADALQVSKYAYCHVEFRGSYRVRYAAASACCLHSFLRRKGQDSDRSEPDLQRYLDKPAHGMLFQTDIWTATFVRKHIAGGRKRFQVWFDDPKPEVALEAMAWWTATLIFFREMAILGFPRKGKLDLKRLDLGIESALKQIRGRILEDGKLSHGSV